MAKRPEGLSPNFDSIISPQIPSSFIFSWTFIKENANDYQKNAEVKVYAEGAATPLFTFVAGVDSEANLETNLLAVPLDASYEWEVKVTAANNTTALSGRKPFQYVTVYNKGDLAWPDGPKAYEYIGTRQYFDDIRTNAISVLEDYVIDSAAEFNVMSQAELLFTGEIVPSRKDFLIIEEVLRLIAVQESSVANEVTDLIEDSLGAMDMQKIYTFFDRLSDIGPKTPRNVYLSFHDITPLKVASGTAYNAGLADLSIDVKWTPSELDTANCSVNFMSDLTEDVAYYEVNLDAGFSDYKVRHQLFYRTEDIAAQEGAVTIPMEHIYFEHLSTTKKTSYVLNVIAVDKRGRESSPYIAVSNVANVPLGVAKYQLRAEKRDLQNKAVIKSYFDIYNGPAKAYVHKVSGAVDGVYHYAVRLYDKNGTISPWLFIDSSVKVDPLMPPAAPKPSIKGVTTSTVEFKWASVKDAERYEIDPLYGSAANTSTTALTFKLSGLAEKTSYSVRIRATNKAGSSAWVTIAGKTLTKPIIEDYEKSPSVRNWRTSYMVLFQNGKVSYPSARYDLEKDNIEAMHGEWIELRDKYESGSYVRKGTRWGNYKSLFFLDYKLWQTKLKGKEIVEVKFYIRRKSTQHGYPDDGRFLNIYSHNYTGASALPAASKGPAIADHYKVDKLDFDRGQGLWITLPKSYGEKLRDGKLKGIAFHHPSSTRTPYSYMRFDAKTFDFRIKYK